MLPERERPFALSHGVAGMSAMSPPSQQTWKRNSSLARGLDRGLRGCVSAGAPAWPGRGSPLQSWRQARSAKVTHGPQTGSRGKTFLLVVPCHPHPSHPVTEGAFGHQDQVMSRTHSRPFGGCSGPWHQIQNSCHGSYSAGPWGSVA